MASTNRRAAEELPDTDRPSKRHKQGLDKDASNPYLAHMFEEKELSLNEYGKERLWKGSQLYKKETTSHGKEIGPLNPSTGNPLSIKYLDPYPPHLLEQSVNGSGQDRSIWKGFQLHKTSAKMAHDIEEGPLNPFTGKPLSKKYFDILQARRNLPVHLQR